MKLILSPIFVQSANSDDKHFWHKLEQSLVQYFKETVFALCVHQPTNSNDSPEIISFLIELLNMTTVFLYQTIAVKHCQNKFTLLQEKHSQEFTIVHALKFLCSKVFLYLQS